MKYAYSSPCSLLVAAASLAGLLVAGCAFDSPMVDPAQGRAQREAALRREKGNNPPTETAQRDLLAPVMGSINSRIRANEQKIGEWTTVERKTATMSLPQEKLNRIDECRSNLQHILLEYTSLQQQLQREPRVEAAQLLAGNSLLQLNQQEIDYLESGCDNFLTELKRQSQPAVVQPPDPQIRAAYDNGDYDQVLSLYSQRVAMSGPVQPVENTYQYGKALLKNHQELEAQRVLNDLLPRVRQQKGQDELMLRVLQGTADVNFSREAYADARKQYEDLIRLSIEKGAQRDEWAGLQLVALQGTSPTSGELREYTGLVRQYLAYFPKRDNDNFVVQADAFLAAHPGSILTANVNLLKKNSRSQTETWQRQGSAQPAPPVNEANPNAAMGGGVPAVGGPSQQAGPPPATTAGPANTAQPGPGSERNGQGNDGRLDGNTPGVVTGGPTVDRQPTSQQGPNTAKVQPQAQPQSDEAARQAAQDMRQKAAELFVRASSSRDSEEKRRLLLGSRDLLQNILVKYPQSGLTDKVQKNLSRIDAELRALETKAAPRPVSSGGAYVPPTSGGAYVPPSSGTGNAATRSF